MWADQHSWVTEQPQSSEATGERAQATNSLPVIWRAAPRVYPRGPDYGTCKKDLSATAPLPANA